RNGKIPHRTGSRSGNARDSPERVPLGEQQSRDAHVSDCPNVWTRRALQEKMLVDRFDGDKLHGGTHHGFSDRFSVAEVVLRALRTSMPNGFRATGVAECS